MLATVKGDVHDIGKNIVGVVLACNNYEVIDMGVMVPCEKILERRASREGRPDRPERAHHAVARRDGARRARDGAPGLQAAAADRRRDHQPRAHRGQDRARTTASRSCTCSTPAAPCRSRPACSATRASRRSSPQHRAEYERAAQACTARPSRSCVPLEAARANRTPIDVARRGHRRRPSSPACACSTTSRSPTLREFIDWTPFFHTWELKGVYPRILEHEKYGEQARQIFAEANALLDAIIAEKLLTRARRLRLLPRQRGRRRRRALHRRSARARARRASTSCASRRRKRRGEPYRSLGRLRRAARRRASRDHIGAFAVTTGIGLKELCDRFRAEHDDYNAIMAEALADRLAEAFAECLHKRVRDEWGYGRDEELEQRASSSPRSTAASAPPPAIPPARITPRRARSGSCSTSRRTPACCSPSRSRCGPARA